MKSRLIVLVALVSVGSAFRLNYRTFQQSPFCYRTCKRGYVNLSMTQQVRMNYSSASTAIRDKKTPDFFAAASYISATTIQWMLLVSFLHMFQVHIVNQIGIIIPQYATHVTNFVIFALALFASMRSRLFSVLDNRRPIYLTDESRSMKRPAWTPPPFTFPLIWNGIALLRTLSTLLVYQSKQTLLCMPILIFMLHLCIGDTWNTINNVDSRLGTAVPVVLLVLGTSLYTAKLYYEVIPIAGILLAPCCLWFSIASFLVYSIWRLNALYLNDRPSLFPSVEEGPRSPWRLPFRWQ